MNLSELKARDLRILRPLESAALVVELSKKDQYLQPSYVAEHCLDIEHRGLNYTVGLWGGWEGSYWVVEDTTGMIFRGSLTYLKDIIQLCSKVAHGDPEEVA